VIVQTDMRHRQCGVGDAAGARISCEPVGIERCRYRCANALNASALKASCSASGTAEGN